MEFKVVKRGLGKNRKYYFKGSDGKIYGEGYYEAYAFREGFAKVKKFFYKSSFYVSREEFEKTGTSHHYVDNKYSNGFARVEEHGERFYVNREEIKKTGTSHCYKYDEYRKGFNVVYENGKYYFIDEDFKLHGEGYDGAWSFSDGFAIVKKDGEWYFVDDKDFKLHGEGYDYVTDFHGGFARVKKDGKWYYVDKNFELHGEGYDEAWSFSEGFAKVRKGDKWYFVDKNFELHGEGYDEAYFFSEGFADVEKDEQKYTINENFERIKRNNQIMEDVDYLQEAKDDVKSIVGIPAIRFSDDFVNKLKAIVLNHYEKEVEEAKSDKVEALRSEMEYIKKIIDEKKEQYSEKVADPNYQSLLKQAQLLFVKENFNDKEQEQK